MSIAENLKKIKSKLGDKVTLVAVSKYSTDEEVMEAYEAGHRDFGENKAQDLKRRADELPKDIRWHFIGHLQRNKVKYIADFIHMIHAVDSLKLLKEINKRAKNAGRKIPCLLQMHIASEESKFGLDRDEILEMVRDNALTEFENVEITGLMGMATNTENTETIRKEFIVLKGLFDEINTEDTPAKVHMETLSMGMSNDYRIALEEGTNSVRIGSAIFKEE
ncbi:MAG: YggS family pyridoxal phosphate-dependent enzyme [Flavobacteriales bacterium]|nr:YggS family pyridoxal phosphate-dependent enzyme [Flavobacteriales bacterium]